MLLTVVCMHGCGGGAQRPTLVGHPTIPVEQRTSPEVYHCHFTDDKPLLDGKLDDAAWARAPWSRAFLDIRDHHFLGRDFRRG